MDKIKARIANSGMGGFLNPPTHPEHTRSVCGYGSDPFYMNLSSAAESDWLEDSVKIEAKNLLNTWEKSKPHITSAAIQDWIHHCLGYFKNCYSKDGIGRNVNTDLIISKDTLDVNRHLGVMHIRSFYPDYIPCEDDFKNAYWGTKKVEVNV